MYYCVHASDVTASREQGTRDSVPAKSYMDLGLRRYNAYAR